MVSKCDRKETAKNLTKEKKSLLSMFRSEPTVYDSLREICDCGDWSVKSEGYVVNRNPERAYGCRHRLRNHGLRRRSRTQSVASLHHENKRPVSDSSEAGT